MDALRFIPLAGLAAAILLAALAITLYQIVSAALSRYHRFK